MSRLYGPNHRAMQMAFQTRELADRIEAIAMKPEIDEAGKAFIETRDMFFLTTIDHKGRPTVSYKGGAPGFVKVTGAQTLLFPSYDGNGMYLSMGNVDQTGRVGLLFVDFERQRRMRVEGVAELVFEGDLLRRYPECQCVVVVRATAIYPNCPRYVHRYTRAERSPFVPRDGIATPTPDWKRADWARDVLAAGDPALGRERE